MGHPGCLLGCGLDQVNYLVPSEGQGAREFYPWISHLWMDLAFTPPLGDSH